MRRYQLYENTPASEWMNTYPIGNGRMGAVVFGGVSEDVLYLNEESIWSENTSNKLPTEMPKKLAQIRALFLDGKPVEANKLASTLLQNDFQRIRSYESAGILRVSMHENDHCAHYRRTLDLINGVACVEYDKDGSHYTREYFASNPDNVIACRYRSTQKDMCLRIFYDRERILEMKAENGVLCAIASTLFGNHRFCVKIRLTSDGTVGNDHNSITVTDARTVCMYVSIATEVMHGTDFSAHAHFPDVASFEALKEKHAADFSALMMRADIELPTVDGIMELPLSEQFRVREYNKPNDHSLAMLQWQFGRYLLVSSSRHGTLPSNLQGLWTDGDLSPWNSDYHTNINLQMNYWGAEVANLSECHMPLFDYMNRYLLASGKESAKALYGTRGCVVHHLSDIYGFTAMADGVWGLWPHGASWLALHMWEHYLFTNDLDFLKNEAYDFIYESALFFLDNLVTGNDGRLHYAPSTSPENHYYALDADGNKHNCYLAISSTMDTQIITMLFQSYLDASSRLGIENETTEAVKIAISHLPPMKIGKYGQLMEWIEDYEEIEPGHRHIAHMYGLYPANLISRETPELYRAINKTIERRLAGAGKSNWGVSNIGWSLIWLSCAFARLQNGAMAHRMLSDFIGRCVTHALWDKYPYAPTKGVFQIDANLGYVAAVAEMLLQSHEGFISLLPALPTQWSEGSFKGLCARGGFEISAAWKDSHLTSVTVKGNRESECILELPYTQRSTSFCDACGQVYVPQDGKITLTTTDSPITLNAM